MNHLKILLITFVTSLFLSANIYENAEDNKTSRWKILTSDTHSSVNNINDGEKNSRIIKLQGEGTKSSYALKIKEKKMKNKNWLSWEMKFSEDFVIIVLLHTNVGERYLIYTPGIFKSHMHYGLGYGANSGKWQTFSRNLQDDIAYFDNRVKIISLKSFIVKGSGRIDNIISERKELIQEDIPQKIKLQVHKNIIKEETNYSPTITLKGSALVELNLGEVYVETGVTAYDKEDGELNVQCIEDIDNTEIGRYMVLYMATDSRGNIALDKRYVHIGKVNLEELEETIKNDDEPEEIGKEERSRQIKIWERGLELRERELEQKEKNSNEN